jgi:hypothetical protein
MWFWRHDEYDDGAGGGRRAQEIEVREVMGAPSANV